MASKTIKMGLMFVYIFIINPLHYFQMFYKNTAKLNMLGTMCETDVFAILSTIGSFLTASILFPSNVLHTNGIEFRQKLNGNISFHPTSQENDVQCHMVLGQTVCNI